MHRTIFDTPGVNTFLRWFSIGFLKATGWKIHGQLPANGRKSVLIAAPHSFCAAFKCVLDGQAVAF
ncbi:MAG: hypothetical protein RLZZ454_22 [Pseudomonadota bacterium]